MHKNYTLVTCLYRINDNQIQANRLVEYMTQASWLLNSPYNIVFYTTPKICDFLVNKYGHKQNIKYALVDHTTFPAMAYRSKIEENRSRIKINTDPRNTPEYFALCVSKFYMLRNTINLNPFNSTHFAWIDVGYPGKHDISSVDLFSALAIYREKFSATMIDYVPDHDTNNIKVFYEKKYGCIAGGFWTGSSDYVKRICDCAFVKFVETVDQGYGHAEQQILQQVYANHKDWFELYPGDYESIIGNYVKVKNPKNVQRLLSLALANGDVKTYFNLRKYL